MGEQLQLLQLERFSFECRKVIGFASFTLYDWLKIRNTQTPTCAMRYTALYDKLRNLKTMYI